MANKRISGSGLGFKVAAATVVALSCGIAHADQEVKIGFASPMTGAEANWGKDNENSAKMAIEELNKKGLVAGGQKLHFSLQSEDDAGDPRQGTVVAQRLVDSKIVAMVGHFTSGVTIPASRVYHEANVPQFSVAVNSAYTNQGFNNVFRLSAVDTKVGPALAEFTKKQLGAKTVALIDDRTAYSQGLVDQFEAAAKKLGLKVVRREYTDQKSTDMLPILTSLRASKPDAIFVGLADAQAATFARQYKQLGLKSKIIGGDMFQTDQFLKLAENNGEGFMSGVAGGVLAQRAEGRTFLQKYKAKYNAEPLAYGPQHYDAVMMIGEAIKKSGSTDANKLIAALRNVQYKGAVTDYAFDAKGDLKAAPITIYEVKAGQWAAKSVIH